MFWLDEPAFYIVGSIHILPILKEGETESLHQWGIEKPFGIVRTMEDIRKICQLIEMAAREFEGESSVQVPVCHSLEEQIQSLETFLRSLPYLFVKRPNRSIQALMNGAIYVVGHIVVGSMEAQAHWFYPRFAAFARHIAIRLYNGYAPQMHFCTGNILSLQEIPEAVTPHRFYKEANALSLLESPLPLVRIHNDFMFGPNHFAFGPNSMVLTPPDVMKVWQLLEMAVREFIEGNEINIP